MTERMTGIFPDAQKSVQDNVREINWIEILHVLCPIQCPV